MAEFMYKFARSPGALKPGDAKLAHPDPNTLAADAKKFRSDKALTKLKSANPNRYYDILWLAQTKITTGSNAKGTQFSPNNIVNRGSMAQFLRRLYNHINATSA
jgi:hypothetical protein